MHAAGLPTVWSLIEASRLQPPQSTAAAGALRCSWSFRGALVQEWILGLPGYEQHSARGLSRAGPVHPLCRRLILTLSALDLSSSPSVHVTDTCTLWEGDGGCCLPSPRQETLEWAALNFCVEGTGA